MRRCWCLLLSSCMLLALVSYGSTQGFGPSCQPPPFDTSLMGAMSLCTQPAYSSQVCTAPLDSDFTQRLNVINNWNVNKNLNCIGGSGGWGPSPGVLNSPTFPTSCNWVTWAQQRLMKALAFWISFGFNYCHHHIPTWYPTPAARTLCPIGYNPAYAPVGNTSQAVDCGCSAAGINGLAKYPWQGVDCSSFTSWVHNFAFGMMLDGSVGGQACGPSAPGVVLPYNASNYAEQGNLLPGDLLYIRAEAWYPNVTHVVTWTGIQVDFKNASSPWYNATLFNNMDPQQVPLAVIMVNDMYANGYPVYVLVDSHHAGPNYRLFAGWYNTAFSHARRIIYTQPISFPENPSYLVFYDPPPKYPSKCYDTRYGPVPSY